MKRFFEALRFALLPNWGMKVKVLEAQLAASGRYVLILEVVEGDLYKIAKLKAQVEPIQLLISEHSERNQHARVEDGQGRE